jgi:hypothetical protein
MRGAETPLRFDATRMITHIRPANTRPSILSPDREKGRGESEKDVKVPFFHFAFASAQEMLDLNF